MQKKGSKYGSLSGVRTVVLYFTLLYQWESRRGFAQQVRVENTTKNCHCAYYSPEISLGKKKQAIRQSLCSWTDSRGVLGGSASSE